MLVRLWIMVNKTLMEILRIAISIRDDNLSKVLDKSDLNDMMQIISNFLKGIFRHSNLMSHDDCG